MSLPRVAAKSDRAGAACRKFSLRAIHRRPAGAEDRMATKTSDDQAIAGVALGFLPV